MALKNYRVGKLTFQFEEGEQPKGAVEVKPTMPAEDNVAEDAGDNEPAGALPPAEPAKDESGEQSLPGDNQQEAGEGSAATNAEDAVDDGAKAADVDNSTAGAGNK